MANERTHVHPIRPARREEVGRFMKRWLPVVIGLAVGCFVSFAIPAYWRAPAVVALLLANGVLLAVYSIAYRRFQCAVKDATAALDTVKRVIETPCRRRDIEARIRNLAALAARADAVKPGHPLAHELEIEISALRWVLGEMDEDMMGKLIERTPGSRARYEPQPGDANA